jgi:hypothetical protein
MLFVYVAADKYLRAGGHLGFVITQTVFKTRGAGDGFRRFQFEFKDSHYFLKPLAIDDLSDLQVFEGATNRTAVFTCAKSSVGFDYPVRYIHWSRLSRSRIAQEESISAVFTATARQEWAAVPIEKGKLTSPWLTAPRTALVGIQKALGKSPYKGWEGANTGGLNGAYWIRVVEQLKDGDLLIENLWNVGKIKVEKIQAVIEPALVYPLLRGRDVGRWIAEPSAYIILAQDPTTRTGIPEQDMKRNYPKTYEYLKRFEAQLRKRSAYRQYFQPTDPFWSMYNIGVYTLAAWKVLWPEVGHAVRSGACGPQQNGLNSIAIPDHTIVAVPCESKSEAFFLSGLLNSTPAQVAASGYIVLHPSPHILEHIAIPKFSKEDSRHLEIAQMSERCHKAALEDDIDEIGSAESEIDKSAAKIWNITTAELRDMQQILLQGAGEMPQTAELE